MQNGKQQERLSGFILLIEPRLERRQHIYELLTREGYHIQAVSSQATALDALQHDWPQLILTNAELHDSTGFILAHHIRVLHDAVPIIVMGVTEKMRPIEADDVQVEVSGDIDDEELLKIVGAWIRLPKGSKQRLPCSVLIVDDEPKLRMMLQRFLEMHNFTVTTAASGEEALQQLSKSVPMFVLLDVGMDGMDGLLTLKKIKTMATPTNVIMVTGNSEAETLKEAMALGAQDYINKPFSPAYLESVLLSKLFTG